MKAASKRSFTFFSEPSVLGRGLDADGVLGLDVFAEQIVSETEGADEIHDLSACSGPLMKARGGIGV